MKQEDPSSLTMAKRDSSDDVVVVGKTNYKFWVISAILVLAVWSMFTGSLTLKRSAANLIGFSRDSDSAILNDIDVLEVEEREKLVRRMWDVYTHNAANRIPRFWSDAFRAAYEHLVSDVRGVRDAAVSEIAKMSLRSFNLDNLPLPSESRSRASRKMKQAENSSVGNLKGEQQLI